MYFLHREQPVFSTRAHVFQIDPATKKSWLPCSKQAVTVSFYYDPNKETHRIISVDGTKVRKKGISQEGWLKLLLSSSWAVLLRYSLEISASRYLVNPRLLILLSCSLTYEIMDKHSCRLFVAKFFQRKFQS